MFKERHELAAVAACTTSRDSDDAGNTSVSWLPQPSRADLATVPNRGSEYRNETLALGRRVPPTVRGLCEGRAWTHRRREPECPGRARKDSGSCPTRPVHPAPD